MDKPCTAAVASNFKKIGSSIYLRIPKRIQGLVFPLVGFLIEPDALINIHPDGSFTVRVLSHAVTEKDFQNNSEGNIPGNSKKNSGGF